MQFRILVYLLLAICLFNSAALRAQDSITVDETTDSSGTYDEYGNYEPPHNAVPARKTYFNDSIEVKHFDKDKWKNVTKGVTYKEQRDEPEKEEDKNSKNDGNSRRSVPFTINSQGFKVVLVLILVAVVCFILYYLLKDASWFRNSKLENNKVTIDNLEDELPEDDVLRKLLKEALANGDYKAAIRYYYLILMAHYRQQGLIVWKKDKTNRHYLHEMRNHVLYADIRTATNLFDSYWYGDLEPNRQSFDQAEVLFNRLLNG